MSQDTQAVSGELGTAGFRGKAHTWCQGIVRREVLYFQPGPAMPLVSGDSITGPTARPHAQLTPLSAWAMQNCDSGKMSHLKGKLAPGTWPGSSKAIFENVSSNGLK